MSRPTGRRFTPLPGRSLLVAALVALIASLGTSGSAVLAHAEVVEITPANNAVVPDAPAAVTVRFTEPVSLSGGSTQVFDDTGEVIATDGSVSDSTVTIPLPSELADGTYVVAWRVISADSHPISGSSVFSVGAPSTTSPIDIDAGPEIPAVASGWRVAAMAASYAGVLAALGGWWFARRWYAMAHRRGVADPDAETDGDVIDALAGLDRWRVIAGVTGIVALLLALPVRLVTVGGGWDALSDGDFVSDTLTGPIGAATLVTILGVLGLLLVRPSHVNKETIALGLLASLAALGGFAIEGHTRTKDPTWLMIVSDIVHTGAGAVWFGGVVVLAVMLRRATGAWRARAVLDVSTSALAAVVVVSVAGVVMSVIVLPTFNALADTGYGLALMVKVALVIVLVAMGAKNRLVLVPAIEESEESGDSTAADLAVRRLRRMVTGELVVFAALLVATATLVGRSPVVAGDATGTTSEEHENTGILQPVTVPLSTGVGSVTITLDPGQVGSNMLMLTLVDNDGAPLTLVEPPTVELREEVRGIGPLALSPDDIGNSTYHALTDIPFEGTWQVSVRARTSTFDSGLATTEFVVGG